MEADDENVKNEVDDGYTSLHAAADFGHAEVAELLLQRGARVDAKIEQSEWTPLGCASVLLPFPALNTWSSANEGG